MSLEVCNRKETLGNGVSGTTFFILCMVAYAASTSTRGALLLLDEEVGDHTGALLLPRAAATVPLRRSCLSYKAGDVLHRASLSRPWKTPGIQLAQPHEEGRPHCCQRKQKSSRTVSCFVLL